MTSMQSHIFGQTASCVSTLSDLFLIHFGSDGQKKRVIFLLSVLEGQNRCYEYLVRHNRGDVFFGNKHPYLIRDRCVCGRQGWQYYRNDRRNTRHYIT